MKYNLTLILILAGIAVLFIIQNTAVVETRFLFGSSQMSRSLLVLLLLAIGIIIGWFLRGHLKDYKEKSDNY